MAAKSYTQWSIFKSCGAKYEYQYVQRLPMPERAAAADRGVNIHGEVEKIIKGEADEFPLEMAQFADYAPFFRQLRDLGAIAEYPFVMDDQWKDVMDGAPEHRWIRGFIDIIVPPKEPGPLYIYELKTGKEYQDHVDQRHFYGTVALSLFPKATESVVIGTYLDQGENRQNKYPRSMLRTYHYMWNNRLKQLEMPEAYIPNPGVHCRWCPFSKDKGGPCKFSGD